MLDHDCVGRYDGYRDQPHSPCLCTDITRPTVDIVLPAAPSCLRQNKNIIAFVILCSTTTIVRVVLFTQLRSNGLWFPGNLAVTAYTRSNSLLFSCRYVQSIKFFALMMIIFGFVREIVKVPSLTSSHFVHKQNLFSNSK